MKMQYRNAYYDNGGKKGLHLSKNTVLLQQ